MKAADLVKTKAVFLDRDGVLNDVLIRDNKPYSPASLDELRVAADAPAALAALEADGFLLIVVTNQPNVARGTQPKALIEAMHTVLRAALPLTDVFVCYHDDADGCRCRKPLPGLLLDAAAKYDIDLRQSYLIGDRWKDVEAGQRAGCAAIFLDRAYDDPPLRVPPAARVTSLSEAVAWILRQTLP